jgi:prefoldin subunit 5
MLKLSELFSPQKRLLQQDREIKLLRKELQSLQSQNASMREGMRRCVTCEYRIDYKNRQGGTTDTTG